MGMGPGMMQPMNPFGQQPPQQAPVMYDNIKKLLEKKPVVDDASMDFLEGIGDSGGAKVNSNPSMEPVRTPEPVANPFGAPQAPASDVDFSFLGGGGGAPLSLNRPRLLRAASPALLQADLHTESDRLRRPRARTSGSTPELSLAQATRPRSH